VTISFASPDTLITADEPLIYDVFLSIYRLFSVLDFFFFSPQLNSRAEAVG
jgi:hypothetical protein